MEIFYGGSNLKDEFPKFQVTAFGIKRFVIKDVKRNGRTVFLFI